MGVITVTNNKNDKKRTSKKSSFVKRDKNLSTDRSFSIVDSKSPFTITEAYKSLRTNIIFSTGDNGCKKYVVTSPVPGEGKTTNSVNTAISFAQTGKRVLLVDADLRKPRIHKHFEVDNKVGLSNLLSGVYDGENKNIINKTKIENLDLITAGRVPPNPIELLSSENMTKFMESLDENYDFVIVDTPPINVVSDALVLSKLVTGYILVLRSNYSEQQSVDNAISKFELANVKPLGIILNDHDENRKKYTSRYRYKGYYYYSYYSRNNNN